MRARSENATAYVYSASDAQLRTGNERTVPTRYVGPGRILDIKADKVLKVQEDGVEGVKLISKPKVRETHVEEGSAEDATQNTKRPKSSFVPQRPGWIEQEQS